MSFTAEHCALVKRLSTLAKVKKILGMMRAAGYVDVVDEACQSWTNDEIADFLANYESHYLKEG